MSNSKWEVTNEQLEQYQKDGYLFLPNFFDDDVITRFRNEANRILELVVNSSLANDRKSKRLGVNQHDDGSQSVRMVYPFMDLSRVFKRVAIDDLPTLLRPLMDDVPVSLDRASQLNYKQPLPEPIEEFDGRELTGAFPVHADWPSFSKKVPPGGFFISTLFIDACTENNGPVEVWPGTHKEEFEEEKTDLGSEVPPTRLDHDAGRKILGPAGSILIFNSRLVHSSEPNSTERPRRVAIYRHASARNVTSEVKDGSARPGGFGYPREVIESTYENEYRRLKRQGKFEDRFSAPAV